MPQASWHTWSRVAYSNKLLRCEGTGIPRARRVDFTQRRHTPQTEEQSGWPTPYGKCIRGPIIIASFPWKKEGGGRLWCLPSSLPPAQLSSHTPPPFQSQTNQSYTASLHTHCLSSSLPRPPAPPPQTFYNKNASVLGDWRKMRRSITHTTFLLNSGMWALHRASTCFVRRPFFVKSSRGNGRASSSRWTSTFFTPIVRMVKAL